MGKILIQRDESKADKPAVLYYKKLPPNISDSFVILVDPMLATGGSAIRALTVLKVSTRREEGTVNNNLMPCSGSRSEDGEHSVPEPGVLS